MMPRPRKVLITGCSGFCGFFLSEHFSRKGIAVVGLDTAPHPARGDLPGFTFHACDIRDRRALRDIFAAHEPTHVIHMAYMMDPSRDRELEYRVDVAASRDILGIADAAGSVRQLVLMSSLSAYGARPDNPEWLTEGDPLRADDYTYAAYKRKVEEHYAARRRRPTLKVVVLRMCIAVGPHRRKPGGVVELLAGAPFLLSIVGGNNRAQFIHEEEVIDLFDMVVHDPEVEGTYNVCPDSFVAIEEIAEALGKPLVPVPLAVIEAAFGFLWHLRLAKLTPPMARYLAHGIIASPKKIMARYDYTFKHSSKEAFLSAAGADSVAAP